MLKYVSQISTFLHPKLSSTPSIRTFFTEKKRSSKNNINTVNLNPQQQAILKAISQTQSVFITGPAGTGKSFLLLQIIELLKRKYQPYEVFVTASTGVAACALKGRTLHSFSGVDDRIQDRELLLKKVMCNKPALKRWEMAKALVLDEVSMINGELFDNLEYIARSLRPHVDEPWGGIQLIVTGDFFQLPPVNDDRGFAFESECWNSSFDFQVELTENFRQSNTQFQILLQGIRRGEKDEHHLKILQQCFDRPVEESMRVPSLYPKKGDAHRVNEEWLKKLSVDNAVESYTAKDTGKEPWKSKLNNGMVPKELQLCIGARVMLIKNKDLKKGLVNGATGTVICFDLNKKKSKGISATGLIPRVKFDSGVTTTIEPEKWEVVEGDVKLAKRKQIPLILAWALSVHKCQGMTLDRLHTDLAGAFGYGMVYVALSRVKNLEGLYLSGFDPSKIEAHPKVIEFYDNLWSSVN